MMFGKKEDYSKAVEMFKDYEPIAPPKRRTVFIEFEGAMASVDEDTNKLEYTPRGPIWIQAGHIGAYYDHTILLFGNKIRVMETAAQIAVKIMEALK